MSLTPPETSRPRTVKPAVALGKLGGSVPPIEVRVRLIGEAAAAFKDYERAYQAAHGEPADQAALAAQMIAAFIESDRGFAAWRRSHSANGA